MGPVIADFRVLIFDCSFSSEIPIKNHQSKIENVETHPLPRDGTGCGLFGSVATASSSLLVESLPMRECPRCEVCFEDDVLTCPTDESNTKSTLPGTKLLASRYLPDKR